MLEECFRHAKAIGAWGAGRQVLEAAWISGAGVAVDKAATPVLDQVHDLLGSHRVWERLLHVALIPMPPRALGGAAALERGQPSKSGGASTVLSGPR
jgi:C-terminal domain found in long catalases